MNKPFTYTVSNLNAYIKSKFDNDFTLRGLRLEGELSNFKVAPSGHIYFTLKDELSSIKGVMFSEFAKNRPLGLKDGDKVIALGYVSVYVGRGEYQFYAQAFLENGLGDQLLKFEELKRKLAAEGLFDESRKRKINIFPKAIGVISAKGSAAMKDIYTNIMRRYPLTEVKMFPSLVQGEEAPKDLLRALNEAKNANIDTLIIGRGGGSNEDLSAFNDEELVRAVASFPVPVISAVGHEVDFTLIDFVADKRASTPTGAAELATIDKREIYEHIDKAEIHIDTILNSRIKRYSDKLESIASRSILKNPANIYREKREKLEQINKNLDLSLTRAISKYKEVISLKGKHLESLSVDNVYKRGYSLVSDESGNLLTSMDKLSIDQVVNIHFKDGIAKSKVISKEK